MSRAFNAAGCAALIAMALSLGECCSSAADETYSNVTAWLETAPQQSNPFGAEEPTEHAPLRITDEEPPSPPPGQAPPGNPFIPQQMRPPDLRCLNPEYEDRPVKDAGFWEFFPEGMWPWSGRTPISDRHTEHGHPLTSTSWLNRPYYAGWRIGAWCGDELIDGEVGQHTSFFGGYHVGWDYDYFWGMEARLAMATPTLEDHQVQNDYRTADVLVTDLNLMYYPWGDSCWRPYASLGLGIGYFIFRDSEDRRFREVLVGMPLGIGIKYRWHEWLVLRADLEDNIMFGGAGLSPMGNFSLTGGVEVRFGAHRTLYWPYHPGGFLW